MYDRPLLLNSLQRIATSLQMYLEDLRETL